jgi:hypothetical protein
MPASAHTHAAMPRWHGHHTLPRPTLPATCHPTCHQRSRLIHCESPSVPRLPKDHLSVPHVPDRFPSPRMHLHADCSLQPTSDTAATSTRSQPTSRTSLTNRTLPTTSCPTSSPLFPHRPDPPPWTAPGEPPSTPLPPQMRPSPSPRALAVVPDRPSPPAGQATTTLRLRPELPCSSTLG